MVSSSCHLGDVKRDLRDVTALGAESPTAWHAAPALREQQPSPQNSLPTSQKTYHVLVGVTGSVAALKLPVLVSELLEIPGLWKGRTDPVLHIDLRRWADLMLVAPLDANTLAKIANGICDNLLTCVIRAWDMTKPLLFCPAMNTAMWEHPITAQQVEQLKDFGYTEIPCVVKRLVCGDEGRGAMAEVWTIVEKVKAILSERDLLTQS
ncbi:phosphopantothenoylcysteine decarboxylase isoform 3-T6 [Pangshura tecta]